MFDWFKSNKAKSEKENTEETKESLTSPEELRELIKTDLQKIESTKDEVNKRFVINTIQKNYQNYMSKSGFIILN